MAGKLKLKADSGENPGARTIRELGGAILREESAAIADLAGVLDENFERFVERLAAVTPEQRVVVTGIGKAGFIAMKFSATLASTGIPSFFLHPAEAVHGDLGRCSARDLVIVLSNSGETPEIIRLIPQIRRIGATILSITGKACSTLARHSEISIVLGRVGESGHLGLAPTTSTTLMLALADALALSAAQLRGFSREEFALYHPGGELGRSLLLVGEIMRSGEEHCIVTPELTTREVVHRMVLTKGRPGAVSVIDGEGKLIGIFTDGDLRRWLDKNAEFLDLPVGEVMGHNPKTVRPDQFAEDALRVLSERQVDQVIVVDEGNRPVGLLDIQDLVNLKLREAGGAVVAMVRKTT